MNVGVRDWIFRWFMRRMASSALRLELQSLAFYARRLMNSPVQFPSNVSLGAQMADWVIFMFNSQVQEWKKLLPKVSISFKPCHYPDIWTADTWVYSLTSFISLAHIHNSKKFCFVSTIFFPPPCLAQCHAVILNWRCAFYNLFTIDLKPWAGLSQYAVFPLNRGFIAKRLESTVLVLKSSIHI